MKFGSIIYRMVIDMNEQKLNIAAQLRAFLEATGEVQFESLGEDSLPTWVEETDCGVVIEYHAPNPFGAKEQSPATSAQLDVSAGYSGGLPLTVSSAGRTVFELLNYVNYEAQFTHAAEILRGLVNLRPSVMQLHLEQCRSIKTKRLVLFFGNHYKQSWYAKEDLSKVDLGSGSGKS